MYRYLAYLFLFQAFSCSSGVGERTGKQAEQDHSDVISENTTAMQTEQEKEEPGALSKTEEKGDFSFKAHVIEAYDFLKRKGEQIAGADIKKIKQEQVMLFEISYNKPMANILEKQQVGMDENELVNYFSSAIQQDMIVMQNNKEVAMNGVFYESSFGASNKVRCIFYLSGLKLEKKFEVLFNDRIFRAGLIKYNFN